MQIGICCTLALILVLLLVGCSGDTATGSTVEVHPGGDQSVGDNNIPDVQKLPIVKPPDPLESGLHFEHISMEQGLSQSVVMCVLKDQAGFMWFCTQDGLNRYDGNSFKVFKNDPEDPDSISDNFVTSIYEDEDGVLWLGTGTGGLNRYDPKTGKFKRYNHDPNDPLSLGDNAVQTIHPSEDGILWLGTDGGLDRFDTNTGQFTHYTHDPENPNSLADNQYLMWWILWKTVPEYCGWQQSMPD